MGLDITNDTDSQIAAGALFIGCDVTEKHKLPASVCKYLFTPNFTKMKKFGQVLASVDCI